MSNHIIRFGYVGLFLSESENIFYGVSGYMSTKTFPWFRMYSDFIFDEKIEFIAFEDQRHFVFLLCMKNLGLLDKGYPSTEMFERVIARRLGLFGEAFDNAKKRLIDSGLIDSGWQPVNWNKRQFISDNDPTHAERQRRYREKQRVSKSDVTRDVTVTVTDTDTDTDTYLKPRASRIPADWKLTQEYIDAALAVKAIDLDELHTIADGFRDYWIAIPGQKGVKLDWLATWRNWIRRAKTTAPLTVKRNDYVND